MTGSKYFVKQAPFDEDQSPWLPSDSVDLICVLEAIHHGDPAMAAREAARQLRSGGTLAVVQYSRPVLIENAEADNAWQVLLDAWMIHCLQQNNPHTKSALLKSGLGVDLVPLPEELFLPVRRIHCNWRYAQEMGRPSLPSAWSCDVPLRFVDSQVGLEDVIEETDDFDGWGKDDVNLDWMKGLMNTLVPTLQRTMSSIFGTISKGRWVGERSRPG